jgi:ketosteroid isomerase-like protein
VITRSEGARREAHITAFATVGNDDGAARFSSRTKRHAYFVPMASANVDLVCAIYAAWKRGDFSSANWADPEIEYIVAGGPAPWRWTELAGMRAAWLEWSGELKDIRTQADEYRELDDDRVLVLVHRTGRAKSSGIELDQMQTQGAHVHHVRGSKVIRLVHYWDSRRALADLGLTHDCEASAS